MSDEPNELETDVQLQEAAAAAPAADVAPVVFAMQTALDDLTAHAEAEPQHEIGGILLGSVIAGERPVVLVENIIRGTKMSHARGSVTFTHETWSEINAVKDRDFPDAKVVGWYHSHPGFGLFLSGHDLFIHRNFFTAPWQVAIVTDPQAHTWGCFTWRGNELQQDDQVHVVAVQWRQGEGAEEHPAQPPAPAPAPPAPREIVLPAPLPRPPAASLRGVSWALGLVGMLLALLIGIALASYVEQRQGRAQLAAMDARLTVMQQELQALRAAPAPPPAPAQTEKPAPAAAPAEPAVPSATPTPSPPEASHDATAPPAS